MTLDSIPLRKTNFLTFSLKRLAITGSHLLINSIVSLTISESPFETYEMLGCLTVLKIAGPLRAAGGEG